MGNQDRYQVLLARAERAFAGEAIEHRLKKVRAIIGVPHVPDSEKAAQEAFNKLKAGEEPTPKELAALELVIRMMRPAPLSRQGMLEPLPAAPGSNLYNPETVALWDDFRERVKGVLYSVGRIDRAEGGGVGTGFVVAPGLLVTNRHVVAELSHGSEALEEGQAVVRFYQEFGVVDPPRAAAPVLAVAAIHPRLDMALLRIKDPERRPTLTLDDGATEKAEPVAAIGYPFKDEARNPIFADAIFQGRYGVKRAALGEVTDLDARSLFHDCSTLGGNSGSPLFSLKTARVVGLHRSGFFMYRNEAVAAAHLQAFVAETVAPGAP